MENETKTNALPDLAAQYQGTQVQLARAIGVDQATFSRWLTGVQEPRHPKMIEYAIRWLLLRQRLAEEKD